MLNKKLTGVFLSVMLVFCVVGQSEAIIFGEPDGDEHQYVGLAVFDDASGNPVWRCSGSLISPTIFLTSAHCTDAPVERATIWFESDVDAGIPGNGYPLGGPTSVDGTPYAHPLYNPGNFPSTYDVGVIVLDNPVIVDEYGELPVPDEIGSLPRPIIFTIVGYGLQETVPNPKTVRSDRIRYKGSVRLLEYKSNLAGETHMRVSSNPGKAARGGECFGDSGGPALIEGSNVITGIGSYGLNGNCIGSAFYQRIDTQEVLDWLNSFLP